MSGELGEPLGHVSLPRFCVDAASCARGHSELRGVADKIGHSLIGCSDKWVLNSVPVRCLDHETAGELIALGHLADRAFRDDPAPVCLTIGRECRSIDGRKDADAVKLFGDPLPLDACILAELRWRLWQF